MHEMGITQKAFRKIISTMSHNPIHLTRESTYNMVHRLGQPSPWAILQSHRNRLRHSLQHKIQRAVDTPMDAHPPDVIALTPDYPHSDLDTPTDATQPHAQDPHLACPECHRRIA